MRIILLGAPGAGKGTQATFIAERYQICKISTGDILRSAIEAKSPIGLQAQKIMEKGLLVSDEIMLALVKERMCKSDCAKGFLLDGFPRTIPQAEGLKKAGITIDYVIEMEVEDEELVKRITGRWVHLGSGRVYHSIFNPPQKSGLDDVTGEPLIQREDDKEATVRKRLAVYHQRTEPLVAYYQTEVKQDPKKAPHYYRVDGSGGVEVVRDRIFKLLT